MNTSHSNDSTLQSTLLANNFHLHLCLLATYDQGPLLEFLVITLALVLSIKPSVQKGRYGVRQPAEALLSLASDGSVVKPMFQAQVRSSFGKTPGEKIGSPLQDSCLRTP